MNASIPIQKPTLSTDISGGEPQKTGSASATGDVPLITRSASANHSASVPISNLVSVPINHADKPEKFNGQNFKKWQQKMMFYLTTLGLSRLLKEDEPKYDEDSDQQILMAIDAWKTSDYLCRSYVMNGLADSLYVYSTAKSDKALWDSLDHKYKIEDVGAKKWIVGQFLDYKMMDSKTVVNQVQELQVIIYEIHNSDSDSLSE